MAFQICDDALDYEADPTDMGKNVGDDFYEGKITLPVILAWQDGSADERAFWQRTLSDGDIKDSDLDTARACLTRHEAVPRALSFAREEIDKAIAALRILADGPVKTALTTDCPVRRQKAY